MTKEEYRAMRKRIGTQFDLALILGCSSKTIWGREKGLSPISEEDADALRLAVAGYKPEFEGPLMVKSVDATPAKRTGDVLQDNIRHWYVEPGYVLI